MNGDESLELGQGPSYETLRAARECDDAALRAAIQQVQDQRVIAAARRINATLTDVTAGDAIRNFLQGYPMQPCALRQGTENLREAARAVVAACDRLDAELREAERILAMLNPREESADA